MARVRGALCRPLRRDVGGLFTKVVKRPPTSFSFWLVAAALAWPLLLGAAAWERGVAPRSFWAAAVYAAAGRVCHQRPDRSFRTAGVQWPVCGRCSGLYLAAPAGAIAAWRRRRRPRRDRALREMLALAAVPTAITLGLEWAALAPMTSLIRMAAALPLGAALAWTLVTVSAGRAEAIG